MHHPSKEKRNRKGADKSVQQGKENLVTTRMKDAAGATIEKENLDVAAGSLLALLLFLFLHCDYCSPWVFHLGEGLQPAIKHIDFTSERRETLNTNKMRHKNNLPTSCPGVSLNLNFFLWHPWLASVAHAQKCHQVGKASLKAPSPLQPPTLLMALSSVLRCFPIQYNHVMSTFCSSISGIQETRDSVLNPSPAVLGSWSSCSLRAGNGRSPGSDGSLLISVLRHRVPNSHAHH